MSIALLGFCFHYFISKAYILGYLNMGGDSEGGGGGGRGHGSPLKNHKNKGFLSNTDPEPLEIHKATKAAFNVTLAMTFCW